MMTKVKKSKFLDPPPPQNFLDPHMSVTAQPLEVRMDDIQTKMDGRSSMFVHSKFMASKQYHFLVS